MVDCFKTQRFTEDLLKSSLLYLFKALDYLHAECHIVHTGKWHSVAELYKATLNLIDTKANSWVRHQSRQHFART